jgi:cysteine desulfurase
VIPALEGSTVYLDYNSTTPVDPRVAEAMRPYLADWFGNPSSSHVYGAEPKRALARARGQVADLIGADPSEIVFTGSGSEADNLALRGAVLAAKTDRPHVITQVTEHPGILETCHALERHYAAEVTYLPVDGDGLVDPAALASALTERTITELVRITRAHGALFHCDAAQAVGKIPLDVGDLGVDLMTIVGHKMYAPKGIAALYVRQDVTLEPLIYGGGQEHGLRSGTENVALSVALGAAARLAAEDLAEAGDRHIAALRDRLHAGLTTRLPGRIRLNGPAEPRLPNTLNISIDGIRGHDLLEAVPDVAASTGSACHSGDHRPSPVLSAMGLPDSRSLAALRISLGRWTTADDIDRTVELLTSACTTEHRANVGPVERAGH